MPAPVEVAGFAAPTLQPASSLLPPPGATPELVPPSSFVDPPGPPSLPAGGAPPSGVMGDAAALLPNVGDS